MSDTTVTDKPNVGDYQGSKSCRVVRIEATFGDEADSLRARLTESRALLERAYPYIGDAGEGQ